MEMPSKCCVVGCKSNYDSEVKVRGIISVFTFPRDESRRLAWIRAVGRENWIPNSKSVVCAKHFRDEDIQRENVWRRADGSLFILKLSHPRLTKHAVPCKFLNPNFVYSNCDSYVQEPLIQRLEKLKSIWEEDNGYVCRLCGTHDSECIPIFQEEKTPLSLELKILKYLQLTIKKGDGLPEKVCPSCFTAVTAWHEFVESCSLIEKKLQEKFEEKGKKHPLVICSSLVKRRSTERKATDLNKMPANCSTKMKMQNAALYTEIGSSDKTQEVTPIQNYKNNVDKNIYENSNNTETGELFSYLNLKDKSGENALNEVQSDSINVKCGMCFSEFPDYVSVAAHMISVHNKGPKQCSFCSLHFNNVQSLENHKQKCKMKNKAQTLESPANIQQYQLSSASNSVDSNSKFGVICVRVYPDKEAFCEKKQNEYAALSVNDIPRKASALSRNDTPKKVSALSKNYASRKNYALSKNNSSRKTSALSKNDTSRKASALSKNITRSKTSIQSKNGAQKKTCVRSKNNIQGKVSSQSKKYTQKKKLSCKINSQNDSRNTCTPVILKSNRFSYIKDVSSHRKESIKKERPSWVHKRDGSIGCRICGKIFHGNLGSIKQHLKTHFNK